MHYLSSFEPTNQKVLVRLDLDLPQEKGVFDTSRMEDSFATLSYLHQHKAAHVTVIAHRGHHPEPKSQYSLAPIADLLYQELLGQKAFKKVTRTELESWLEIWENLRFDPREETADLGFARELAEGQDIFVNDAFATSHRKHTSIVTIPQVLPTYFGFQFEKEMTAMEKLTKSPKRPFVFVLGGAKLDTKLELINGISEYVDVILLGGKLAAEAKEKGIKNRKMIIAKLTDDGFDITQDSAEQFERFIVEAKTLAWNGPMGMFEDGKHMTGTKLIAEAIEKCPGYTVIGGGDTEAAVSLLKINEQKAFSFISSGGGAMLHYLTYRSLPAIEAAEKKQ